MKVYSPSQTSTWLDCPVKRSLSYRQKWRARRLVKRDLAGLLGTAIAAGVGAYHNLRMEAQPNALERTDAVAKTCGGIAMELAKGNMRQLEEEGFTVGEYDRAQAAALPERAFKATVGYVKSDPIPASWSLLAVEKTFEQYGYCRLDVILDDGLGPTVADLKCKLTLETKWKQKEIDRYRNHWNMLHYAWVIKETYGNYPRNYYIAFIVLEPKFTTWLEPYPLHPETLEAWETSARRVWRQIEMEDAGTPLGVLCVCVLDARRDGREAFTANPTCQACGGSGMTYEPAMPWMSSKHSDEFGQCEFYGACFDHKWDPVLMSLDYLKRVKKEEETTHES